MSRLWAVALVTLIPLGCSKPEPEGTPPSSKAGTSVAEPPAPGGEVPRPAATELAPFAVGQWSKYRTTMDDGTTAEITYKIVGEEQGAHWVEIVRGAAEAGTVMQLLVKLTNRSDPSSIEIKAARIRMPNSQVKELREDKLGPSADGYRKALADIFVPSLAGTPQEDVTVPAATFRGAYKRQQKMEVGQTQSDQNVWIHPAVPISGVVKSEEIGKPAKTELVTWGTTGAKSELRRDPAP
ncbi:MAG: hypothetical protein IT375_09160 [Polyangiaceae bacterium]|nr:hypothetical protein [Polyangiaceae bacterium]